MSVSSFLQVVFTEPVRKVAGNVTLEDEEGAPVAIKVSGTLRNDGGVVDDLETSPDAVVTGLTIQPRVGLQYGTTYTLELTDGIEDLDTTPAALVPYETRFETFQPESLIPPGEGETYGSPGIVVLGDRAYLVENHFYGGTLKAYEATDPIEPREIESARYSVTYRPVDIVGEAESPLTGGRLVAVATGPPARSTPSNVWLLDVSNDAATQWIGAVSLTSSALDGFINRTFMRNGFLYAATYRKGIQAIDLGTVIDGFKAPGTDAFFQMSRALFTDGRGFGQENVVSIPVSGPPLPGCEAPGACPPSPARLEDLEAGPLGPEGRVAVVATGDTGLTIADPGTLQVLSSGAVTVAADSATLTNGRAIGLGKVAGYDIAVLAGWGTAQGEPQTLVMVADISNPSAPVGLGWTILEDATVGDILVKDDLALLGGSSQVTVVALTDPTQPRVTGTLAGVGGRLALTESGLLYSTARSVFGGETELGGVRTAALGPLALIQKITPSLVPVDDQGNTAEPVKVTYKLIGVPELQGLGVEVTRGDQRLGTYPAPGLSTGTYDLTIPAGLPFDPPDDTIRVSMVNEDGTPGPSLVKQVSERPAATGPGGTIVLVPEFESLSPVAAPSGGGDVPITVSGRNLSGVTQVFVNDPANGWTAIPTMGRTATTTSFTLPGSHLEASGFLQVSWQEESEGSLAFLVSDPALPAVGSGQGYGVTAVEPQELGPGGGVVRVGGSGLVEGMRVVLGRAGMALTLDSELTEDGRLMGALRPDYVGRAQDLFVAVLSPDGTKLSAGIPVKSTSTRPTVDYTRILPAGQATVTSMGPLLWNEGEQQLELEGIGLQPGMLFQVSSGARGTTTVAAATSSGVTTPTIPPSTRVKITVPDEYTRWPDYFVSLVPSDPRLARSRPKRVGPQPAVFIPVGGRKKFVAVYNGGLDDRVYVLPQDDPAAGRVTGSAPAQPGTLLPQRTMQVHFFGMTLIKLPPAEVSFTFTNPTIPHPFSGGGVALPPLPLVEREINPWDPDFSGDRNNPNVFYLRGVRSAVGNEGLLTVTATRNDAQRGTSKGEARVLVAEGDLGRAKGGAAIDAAISTASATSGIPPQFLKAQVEKETNFEPGRVRYEAMGIDFKNLSRDGAPHRSNSYVARHLIGGPAPSLTDANACLVVVGANASPVPATIQGCPTPVPYAAPVVIGGIGSVLMRGRVGMPADAQLPDRCYSNGDEVHAERPVSTQPPIAQGLNFQEAPYWSHAASGGNGDSQRPG